ncbi:MAG TPA: transporter substrate-binding domain-containing protein [Noviherbaspirillum sp.]|nr:transporter substrate-binding domain-containing protein [Noviherbaspirillum sp.]
MGRRFLQVWLFISFALATAAQARELRVAGTHFARVFELAPNGEYTGLGADLIREIARRTGDTVRFAIYPWVRAQALVERGEADILIGPYKTPEREARFAFSDRAFYQDRMLFYVRTGAQMRWDGDYDTLRGRQIAAVHGWVYGAMFDRLRDTIQMQNVQTLENGLMMLVHGRIEMLATNQRNTEDLLLRLDLTGKVQPILPPIAVQDGYFAFPKSPQYGSLRATFNEVFNSMVNSGELARLARKHDVHIP